MIAIIDYQMGNLCSVQNALNRLGAEHQLTADAQVLRRADRVLLPGVGNAAEAMAHLRERGLTEIICSLRRPVLGICVGMQVMCRHTEEGGGAECMGIFDARVRRFQPTPTEKVPHVGWNTLGNMESKLLRSLPSGAYVYYVHSYYAQLCPDTIATTRHGLLFSAALKYEQFYGTQFHPEKSGDVGEQILRNFLEL